jgi:hypothetical protein
VSDTPQRRQAMVLSDPGPRGGAFTTPGYYVVDRFAVAQDGPFGTPSEALANLAGRDGIQFLDQPVTPSTVEEFPPSLRQSLGSRKAPMSLTRTAAELRSAELDLMQRMASSAPAETAAMMPELEAIRREAQRSNEETYDWEATRRPAWSVSHTAATSETQSSSKSDWLLDIPLPGHVAATTIVAAANLWFESVPALVRGHWGEYAMQAHSAAKTEMGRRHADTDAYRVFMDTAERLHKVAVRREGTDSLLPWSAVVPPLPPTMVGPNSAPDMNQVPQEPGNTGQPLPLPGMAVADDEFGYEPSVDEMAQASAPGNANTGTVADMGFQDMSLEPNRNPAVAARRVTADAGEDSDSDDEDDNESQAGGYSPFSDPLSSYNNPGKGPHDGTPFGGIPLRGPLTPEQQAWMDKGRRKRTGSAAFSYPRQSYEQYLAAISEGATAIPRELWSGMAAAIAPVGPSAQRMASRRTEAKGKGLCQWHECRNNGTQVFDTGSGRVNVCADHAENVIDQESKRPSLTAAQRTAAAKPVRHNDVRVKIVKRLQNSTNGNPRFDLELHHPDGDITRHRTMSDASASYDVENVHNSGEPVDVELTPKGNVRSIYTKRDKNRAAAMRVASQDELGDAIDAHARSERGTIKVGDQIGPHTITDVGTHTIQHVTPNGWSGSRQIPFIDGTTGQSLPSHRRALGEADGLQYQAAKPGQVNYSDPTGANVGRNQSPGAGDWGNTLPEAGDNQSPLTNFPDTGPTYLPSTRSESPETTDYQGYRPNDAPQPVSGQYQASLRRTAAGDHEGLDDAVEGYKRAALWTTPHEDPEGSDHNGYLEDTHSTGDFHPDSHAAISHDVNRFLHENDADARHAADKRGWDGVGHDIWLDRNQHGTGAWDRGLGKAGDRLSEAGRKMGEDSVYKGDDNLIHSEREGRTTPYTARRRPMRTAGLYLAADDDDEPKPSMKARSPQGWINDGNAESPDAASSQLLVDWTGDHDPVSYLGVPPVQGYEYNSGRPNGEMFPWSAGPVGSAPTGAAAVWGVPTPGAANLAQEGSSYPQPR